jgi:signal transduction histidine kinase
LSNLFALIKRRTLRIGILGALLPLIALLGLQTWWLIKLEQTSILAGKAALTGFLDAVTSEIVFTYGTEADRALDIPPGSFATGQLDRASVHFRRAEFDGAKRLFVVRFSHDAWGKILFYDPDSQSMFVPEPSDETRAITVACAPWKLMHSKAIEVDSARMVVEERDHENRILINPIIGPTSRLVGVAGMILDVGYITRRQIPDAVEDALEDFFPRGGTDEVVVTLRDGRGRLRFSTDPEDELEPDEQRPLSFVLTDYQLGIRSRDLTPEQLARVSLLFNVGLSVLAGTALVGGLVLVLRTTAHETRLSRMKSDFVSNVSHELRTPLASIRVFGEFLRLGRAGTPEKVCEYGEYIETESRRLTQLVNNILDFAKIESGGKSYRFETMDVGDVLEGTLKMLEVRLKHDGFEIEYKRPPKPLPPLRIDADALGQAFHNLLDNAVNYSGESRWIGVELSGGSEEVVVSIADRGSGISAGDQGKIFERFHRAGNGLVHDVKGSGLGLSIVRHVVDAHGGRVTVDSAPGRGSVFSIHLPLNGK